MSTPHPGSSVDQGGTECACRAEDMDLNSSAHSGDLKTYGVWGTPERNLQCGRKVPTSAQSL